MRESYEAHRRVFGEDHPETLDTLMGLAGALTNLHRYAEAEPLWRQVYKGLRPVAGSEVEQTLYPMACLGMTLAKQGRQIEGEALIREAVATARRIGSTVPPLYFLAYAVSRAGRFAEADALYREALEASRKNAGERSFRTARLLYTMACSEALRGRRDEAIGYFSQAADAGLLDDSIRDEGDLASLRTDPRYSAIADRIAQGSPSVPSVR